ncbi:MAG: DUF5689 domain-containing protein [Cyclobacteriaceae bacterium]
MNYSIQSEFHNNRVSILISFLIAILIISCNENGSMGPEQSEEEETKINWEQTHTLAESKALFVDGELISDSIIFEATVTSVDFDGKIFLQSDEALAVLLDESAFLSDMIEGTEFLVLATGLVYQEDSNTLSQSGMALDSASASVHFHFLKDDQSVFPKVITDISQIEETDNSALVKVYSVQFEESSSGMMLVGDHTITDKSGNELIVRVESGSVIEELIIPYESGSIEGILVKDNGSFVLMPWAIDHINLTATRHSLFVKKTYEIDGNSMPYQMMYPKGYDSESDETYPLVIFLHGAGERGTNNTSQMANGPGTFSSQLAREDYPAFVIFPQCPTTHMWSRRTKEQVDGVWIFDFPVEEEPDLPMSMVIDLTKEIKATEKVNPEKVYVMGLSMGGIGTIEYLYYAHEQVAAAISIAGGHDPAHVSRYGESVSIRLYHGSNDGVVPPKYSRDLIAALDELPNEDSEYFEAEGRGHEWNYILNEEEEILSWLWSKSRK